MQLHFIVYIILYIIFTNICFSHHDFILHADVIIMARTAAFFWLVGVVEVLSSGR